MPEASNWNPTWSVLPGEVLTEVLADRGMTVADLGQFIGLPVEAIDDIARGEAAIDNEIATRLEGALGISSALWLGLQARYS
jgi:HTH-type transcriptional regulator/antitoxin HigA